MSTKTIKLHKSTGFGDYFTWCNLHGKHQDWSYRLLSADLVQQFELTEGFVGEFLPFCFPNGLLTSSSELLDMVIDSFRVFVYVEPKDFLFELSVTPMTNGHVSTKIKQKITWGEQIISGSWPFDSDIETHCIILRRLSVKLTAKVLPVMNGLLPVLNERHVVRRRVVK